jgi:hypothetical protein
MDPNGWTLAILTLLPLLLILKSTEGTDGTFNSSCRNYKDCNRTQNLKCDEKGTRTCVCPEHNHYDFEHKKCVGKYKAKCHLDTLPKDVLPFVGCIANAKCVKPMEEVPMHTGVCECVPGFGANRYGFCEDKAKPSFQPITRSSASVMTITKYFIIFNLVLHLQKYLDAF